MKRAFAALLLSIAPTYASAQLVIPNPTPPPSPLAEDELAFGDAQTRMTVPVSVGANGPFEFIIDTGAERTVVSRQLAGVLGLRAGPTVRVTAMTGSAWVPTTLVPSLGFSTVARDAVVAPALERRDIGAHGMLGVDALQGYRVSIDFDQRRMTLAPSKRRAAPAQPDDIIVTARSIYGQLIVTNAYWRQVRVAVIVDTGTPVSMGNGALLRTIGAKARPIGPLDLVSAIGVSLRPDAYLVDRFDIGGIGFSNLPIAFSDAPPFKRFGLGDTPALLLGMDAMRLFRRVEIDFAHHTIRFTLPRRGVQVAATTP